MSYITPFPSNNNSSLNQYLYKPGIPGGQIAYGGTNNSENLTLISTSGAIGGSIYLGSGLTTYFNDPNQTFNIGSPRTTNGRVNIETASPSVVGLTIRAHSTTSSSAAPNTVSNLVQWIAASSLDGTLADGANISNITDQSSNAYVWNAGSTPPVYKQNIINGQSVMRFSGSGSNWLTTTITAANFYSTNGMTTFIVMKQNTSANDEIVFSDSNGNALYGNFGGSIYMDWPSSDRVSGSTPGGFLGSFHLVAFTKDSSRNIQILVDNTSVATGTGSHDPVTTGSCTGMIGNYNNSTIYNLIGDIAEIVIYQGKLATADYNNVYNYLAIKYGLPTIGSGGVQSADLVDILDNSASKINYIDASGNAFFPQKVTWITGNVVLDFTYSIIAASGSYTITLPDATTCTGRIYTIKNTSTTQTPTVNTTNSQLVDGATSWDLGSLNSIEVVSNGIGWSII